MTDKPQWQKDMEAGTQGPWVIGPHSETQVTGETPVCSAGGWDDSRIDAEVAHKMKLANARRIARVPKLEAMALAYLDSRNPDNTNQEIWSALDRLDAAMDELNND